MSLTAITNVHVFDGSNRSEEVQTVVIDGDVIRAVGSDPDVSGAEVVDGQGGTLLPGLIDAHIHLSGEQSLTKLTQNGVTTALDMASWPPSSVEALRHLPGLTDIRSPHLAACGPDGNHAKIPGMPPERILHSPEEARQFVANRVAEGVDYIKVVTEAPGAGGPDAASLTALVQAAHAAGLRVIAHGISVGAYGMAQDAGVDVITHVPLDGVLDDAAIARIVADGTVVAPTLVMMAGIVARGIPGRSYESAEQNVRKLHEAGVTLLASTDSNDAPGVPANVPHGTSLHEELGRMVAAGLTPTEALRSATSITADDYNLADRGRIREGLRADLLLVGTDPTADISATQDIRRVWVEGVRAR